MRSIQEWREAFQRTPIRLGSWRSTETLKRFPFPLHMSLFFRQLLILELFSSTLSPPNANHHNRIYIRACDNEEKKFLLAIDVALSPAYSKEDHSDLDVSFDTKEISIAVSLLSYEIHLHIGVIVEKLKQPHVVKECLRMLAIFLRPHTLKNCPSKLCQIKSFCANCKRPWDQITKCESTCYLCGRKYCKDCDFLVLSRNRRKVMCATVHDEAHRRGKQVCSERCILLFLQPWQQRLSSVFPTVLCELILSYIFV